MKRSFVIVAVAGLAIGAIAVAAVVVAEDGPKKGTSGGVALRTGGGVVLPPGTYQIGSPSTPSRLASPNSCGKWSATATIVKKYGVVRNCELFHNTWVLATLGYTLADPPVGGVLGVFACSNDDRECLDGRNDHPLEGWTFITPPYLGAVSIMHDLDDGNLAINVGGPQEAHALTFNIETRTFAARTFKKE